MSNILFAVDSAIGNVVCEEVEMLSLRRCTTGWFFPPIPIFGSLTSFASYAIIGSISVALVPSMAFPCISFLSLICCLLPLVLMQVNRSKK